MTSYRAAIEGDCASIEMSENEDETLEEVSEKKDSGKERKKKIKQLFGSDCDSSEEESRIVGKTANKEKNGRKRKVEKEKNHVETDSEMEEEIERKMIQEKRKRRIEESEEEEEEEESENERAMSKSLPDKEEDSEDGMSGKNMRLARQMRRRRNVSFP